METKTSEASENYKQSAEILEKLNREKYRDVVNLIGKMIVDITLSHDNKESDPLPEIQQ